MLKVEKGIPIPDKHGKLETNLVDGMQVGDSILATNSKEENNVYNAMRRRGMGVTRRKVDGGTRLWRVD